MGPVRPLSRSGSRRWIPWLAGLGSWCRCRASSSGFDFRRSGSCDLPCAPFLPGVGCTGVRGVRVWHSVGDGLGDCDREIESSWATARLSHVGEPRLSWYGDSRFVRRQSRFWSNLSKGVCVGASLGNRGMRGAGSSRRGSS